MSSKYSNRLVICETSHQVRWVLSQFEFSHSISAFIATEVDAAWTLEKSKINYFPFECLQKKEPPEFVERLLKRKIHWAQKVDKFLQDNIPAFKESNFCPARHYLYHLQIPWDTIIHRADLLEKLASDFAIDELFYFSDKEHMQCNKNIPPVYGSILNICIPHWAEFHQISLKKISVPYNECFGSVNALKYSIKKNIFPDLIKNREKIYKLLIRARLLSMAYQSLRSRSTCNIAIKQQYDINRDVFNFLKHYKLSPVHLDQITRNINLKPPWDINLQLKKSWEKVNLENWFWDIGGKQPWSLNKVIEPLFKNFWFEIIPQLWKCMDQSKKIIEREQIRGVVLGVESGLKDTGFLMAARIKKIPIVCYMHGANMGDVENTVWDVADRYFSDYMLLYGAGEVEYIDKHRPRYTDINVKTIPVGSARLEKIHHEYSRKSCKYIKQRIVGRSRFPLILYVPSYLPSNYFRYSYQNIINIKTFGVRKKIASMFSNNNEVHFLYKPFPGCESNDPSMDMLQNVCPSCKIINNIPLTKLQWGADLLIHEMPSTGLHEGLLTNKPIIALVDREVYNMPDYVKKMLESRVVLAETGEEFIDKIKTAITSKSYGSIQNSDNAFRKHFLTYQDDGNSARRAARAICDIVKKTEKL